MIMLLAQVMSVPVDVSVVRVEYVWKLIIFSRGVGKPAFFTWMDGVPKTGILF